MPSLAFISRGSESNPCKNRSPSTVSDSVSILPVSENARFDDVLMAGMDNSTDLALAMPPLLPISAWTQNTSHALSVLSAEVGVDVVLKQCFWCVKVGSWWLLWLPLLGCCSELAASVWTSATGSRLLSAVIASGFSWSLSTRSDHSGRLKPIQPEPESVVRLELVPDESWGCKQAYSMIHQPVSVVSQCSLMPGWTSLRRSAPTYGKW